MIKLSFSMHLLGLLKGVYRPVRALSKSSHDRHRRAIQKADVNMSALAEHAWSTGHKVDLTKARVIDGHSWITSRCLIESWHIQRHPDTLNRDKRARYHMNMWNYLTRYCT